MHAYTHAKVLEGNRLIFWWYRGNFELWSILSADIGHSLSSILGLQLQKAGSSQPCTTSFIRPKWRPGRSIGGIQEMKEETRPPSRAKSRPEPNTNVAFSHFFFFALSAFLYNIFYLLHCLCPFLIKVDINQLTNSFQWSRHGKQCQQEYNDYI